MRLEELMRLCYNAGRQDELRKHTLRPPAGLGGWQEWWEEYGKEREQQWVDEQAKL